MSGPGRHLAVPDAAGWGASAEVLEPPAVRHDLAASAAQLTALYGRTTRSAETGPHDDAHFFGSPAQ